MIDCVVLSGLQSRAVHCILDKRSIVGEENCQASTRPVESQVCSNEECVGVWALGEWSQVSTSSQSQYLCICLLKRKFN